MKRIFDLFLSMIVILLLLAPICIVSIAVKFTSRGVVLYWSDRIRKDNKTLKIPQFRLMLIGAPIILWRHIS